MSTGRRLYSVSELAIEFRKDNRTVEKKLEGTEPDELKGKRRRWYLLTAIEPLLGIGGLDPSRLRAELDEARTRKIDLEIAKIEGTLLDADAVKLAVANMTGRVRARLLAIPGAQAGRANPEDPKRAEAAIRDAVYDALTELADDPFGSGAASTSTETDDSGVGGHVSDVESGVERGAGEVEN